MTLIAPEVAEASDADVKLSVREPAVPVIERPLNVATPFASVATVCVPPSVPPPLAIATVMFTPERDTGLFDESLRPTAGADEST